MANTIRTYESDGVRTTYPIDFALGYIDQSHIFVYLSGQPELSISFYWVTEFQIELNAPVDAGLELTIQRIVPRDRLINDYEDGAILHEQNLDDSHLQHLMILEELADEDFIGLPPTEIVEEILDPVTVTSGQLEVVFSNSVAGAAFYVSGNDVDTGRISNEDIITEESTTYMLKLASSYPEGTVITLSKTQRKLVSDVVEEAPNDTKPYARKSLGWSEALDITHADGTRTHGEIDTQIDVNTAGIASNTADIASNTSDIAELQLDRPNDQTGLSYTPVLTDANKTVWCDNAAANTFNIPLDASVALPIDTMIMVMMLGVGVTTVTAVAGVTVNGIDGGSGDLTQYAGTTLVKRAVNTWVATPLVVA